MTAGTVISTDEHKVEYVSYPGIVSEEGEDAFKPELVKLNNYDRQKTKRDKGGLTRDIISSTGGDGVTSITILHLENSQFNILKSAK